MSRMYPFSEAHVLWVRMYRESSANRSACVMSMGITSLSVVSGFLSSDSAAFSSFEDSSVSPCGNPCAAWNAAVMPPPMSMESAFFARFSTTGSLSATFAPPMTATNGCSSDSSARFSISVSARMSSPAYTGVALAIPAIEACSL